MNDATAVKAGAVYHSTFKVERTYPAPAARVFHAFADPAKKRRWFAEGEGWEVFEYVLDFRVGGAETSRFAYQGGPEIRNDTIFQHIAQDRCIVLSYRMTMGPRPLSVCLATTELVPAGSGTRLIYTEQGVYFDDAGLAQGHEQGCRELLEKLAAEV